LDQHLRKDQRFTLDKMKYMISTALLASSAYAHMQLNNPYPIRSPLNQAGGDNKDYSYTSPLSTSGTGTGNAFPCKGYQNDPFKSVTDYKQGGQYQIGLAGSATHSGGSCQISLSYDTGKTFTVIDSIEGGCPLTSNYSFIIPSDAPTGNALFAWTWFNKVGNREMYMNCAQVTVTGASSKRSHPREMVSARASTAFSARPPLFVANVNGPGQCTTTAGEDVKFPMPGPDVQGTGATGPGFTCKESANFLGSGNSASSGTSGSSSSGSSSSAASTATSSASTSSSSAATSASARAATSTSSAAMGSSTSISNVLPTSGSAPKTVPDSGVAQAGAACASNGAITCGAGGSSFMVCNNGALVSMGSVAAGTTCQNGAIMRMV
jgi:hypothetical protein